MPLSSACDRRRDCRINTMPSRRGNSTHIRSPKKARISSPHRRTCARVDTEKDWFAFAPEGTNLTAISEAAGLARDRLERWITEQLRHQRAHGTLWLAPGGAMRRSFASGSKDGVVKLALALSTDGNGAGASSIRVGAMHAVAEAART